MGTWGTGIYSDDTAEDIRDACRDIFACYDVTEGEEKIFQYFEEELEGDIIDNDTASAWYALADWEWKHGMLSSRVKEKTLALLSEYAGIQEWEESGSSLDVKKRKKVLDMLRDRLQSEQPPLKKPKLHLDKPEHKVGEVVIFRMEEYKWENGRPWKKKNLTIPMEFQSEKITQSAYSDIDGYDGGGKYTAVLCVGVAKELHSPYVPDQYDEYSEYVGYDYLSEEKPTFEQLCSCGFLPLVYLEAVKGATGFRVPIAKAAWTYQFHFMWRTFKDSYAPGCPYVKAEREKCRHPEEVARFFQLLSKKKYSTECRTIQSIRAYMYDVFQEKNRMELLNLKIDNLLDPQIENPELASIAVISQRRKEFWGL